MWLWQLLWIGVVVIYNTRAKWRLFHARGASTVDSAFRSEGEAGWNEVSKPSPTVKHEKVSYSSSVKHNFILRKASLRRFEWLMFDVRQHDSHQTDSKMSLFIEFSENSTNFFDFLGTMDEWHSFAISIFLLTCLSSYLLISKAHAYDNHFFCAKSGRNYFHAVTGGKVPFTWRLSGQKSEYNLPLEQKYLYIKGSICRALQYAGLSLFFLRGS